ncbi:hypothetical protein Tco_0214675 [Tanacetum coccineum]
MVEDVENKNSNISDEPVLLNTPLTDKVESFAPEDDIDEIDAFLAMEVSSNFEEGYFDSEGDVIFLENLLSDDTTHNLAPEVIFDHEPEQNESSITFSPRSDPLHHEFAGELITLPSRIVREHEDYLNRMTLLCEISISRSQENVHANPGLDYRLHSKYQSIEQIWDRPLSPAHTEYLLSAAAFLLYCNAPATFQRCLMAFLHDMIENDNDLKKEINRSSNSDCPHWEQPFELMCDARDYAIWKRIFKKKNKMKAKTTKPRTDAKDKTSHGNEKHNCIKSMLAIPHLSQVSSMAEIDSKEAQKNIMARFRAFKSLTKEKKQERRAED